MVGAGRAPVSDVEELGAAGAAVGVGGDRAFGSSVAARVGRPGSTVIGSAACTAVLTAVSAAGRRSGL